MRTALLTTLGVALAGIVAGTASAQITEVNGNVTTNTTWCDNETTMVLNGPIFVKGGATLTILPPCIVRGQPRTAAAQSGVTAGTPGALIITQDGRIVANGQANALIIFTTATTDNNGDNIPDDLDANGFLDTWETGDTFFDDNPAATPTAPLDKAGRGTDQLWGSLVLLGRAPGNLADRCLGDDDGDPNTPLPTLGWGQCTIEGLTFPGFPAADAAYGGILPHDSSGTLRFVSLRHGGDQFGLDNELNGISLGGVGDGTILENIEVYVNFDDGFEWFGGTVNGKNLVGLFVGDDVFDADEGYTGTNQFLFGVMPFFNENFVDIDPNTPGNQPSPFGFGSGDKGAEFDGENFRPDQSAQNDNLTTRIRVDQNTVNPTPWPISSPDFYNITIIGSTVDPSPDFVVVSAPSTNRGIQFRNGFAGNVHNSIVVNTGAETGIELDTTTTTSPAGFAAIDNANAGLINLVCSTLDDGAAPAAQENTVINNGNALAVVLGGTAPGSNNAVNVAAVDFLVNEDVTFDPTGDANGKLVGALKATKINPRPALSFPPPPIANCPAPTGTGLDPAATYRGAFASAGPLWACPWSVLCTGGLMQ